MHVALKIQSQHVLAAAGGIYLGIIGGGKKTCDLQNNAPAISEAFVRMWSTPLPRWEKFQGAESFRRPAQHTQHSTQHNTTHALVLVDAELS